MCSDSVSRSQLEPRREPNASLSGRLPDEGSALLDEGSALLAEGSTVLAEGMRLMVAIYMFMMGWCGNRPELRRGRPCCGHA